jgi:hypothetical protein
MKKLIVIAVFLFVLPFMMVKAQDPIDIYQGIPLVIYPMRTSHDMVLTYPNSLSQVKDMGVFGVIAPDVLDYSVYLQGFQNAGLKVLPHYLWGNQTYSHIWRYTNSFYTIWEAEGTDPLKGSTTLYYDTIYTTFFDEDGTKGRLSGGTIPHESTLIYGPGYSQLVTYNFSDEIVEYTTEFRLKITQRVPELPENYSDMVVCNLIVTNQKDGDGNGPGKTDTIILRSVKVSDLLVNGWNNWDTINLVYDLAHLLTEKLGNVGTYKLSKGAAYFVQFKVNWGGLDFLNLFIDRVRVYDFRGLSLLEEQAPRNLIKGLVNTYINNSTIIGWYGTDEPGSIDNFEPYRVVDSLINSVSNGSVRLHASITGSWRGTFAVGNWTYGMGHDVYVADEFWLRAKPKNIQLNTYIYHNPWDPGVVPDWKERNIALCTDAYYGRINKYDPNFSVSTQAGAYYFNDKDKPCEIADAFEIPTPSQINYHVNLCLLYGAKELRLDPYFSSYYYGCENLLHTYGLIDPEEQPTDNYLMYKDTIIPRLNDKFGKTLKKINQTAQFANLDIADPVVINFPSFIYDIRGINFSEASTYFLDLGFFENPGESFKYYAFALNRWYSTNEDLQYTFQKPTTLFNNYKLTNLAKDISLSINLANNYMHASTLAVGDCDFFELAPVVHYGGDLITDEAITGTNTLHEAMTIKSGATLTVNGTYNIYGDITVEAGAQLDIKPGAKLNFFNNSRLIVNSNFYAVGAPGNKIEFNFNGSGK